MFWSRKKGEVISLDVDGMRCTQCEAVIKIALRKIPGVHQVDIQKRKTVLVELESGVQVSEPDLAAAIEQHGYKVNPKKVD
ncbi:MAG: heavy-metal-associated domain-containing protein [Anaerolineae bacterium]|nr:heavy-metal-associated domain-containing protein [Anaerolineae bacterium]